MNKKGFTLMEALAVVLIVALLVSLAMPIYRSIRYEVRHSQAEQAAVKMAEALRSFYVASKGIAIIGSFNPSTADGVSKMTSTACPQTLFATGLPPRIRGEETGSIEYLFGCKYLTYKDFENLPYTFTANGRNANLVTVVGGDQAGDKYKNKTFYITRNMKPTQAS